MKRQEIINELKSEKQRAITMGCCVSWIETLNAAMAEIEKLQHIDALVFDSCREDSEIINDIRGLL